MLSLYFWLRNYASWVCAFVYEEIYKLEKIIFVLNILLKGFLNTVLSNFGQMPMINRMLFKEVIIILFKIRMNGLSKILHQENQKLKSMAISLLELDF